MWNGEACCGFCSDQLSGSEEVKELPCCHQFCTDCLVRALEKQGELTCPHCRSSFGIIDLDCLKTVLLNEINTGRLVNCGCGECKSKARAFCKTCGQLFCGQDLDVHDKMFKHGAPISIPEYNAMQQKYGRKPCARHGRTINLACAQCYDVFCDDCLDGNSRCRQGNRHSNKHDVQSIRKLSDNLLSKLETRMSQVKVNNFRIDDHIKVAQQKSDEEEEKNRDILEEFRNKKEAYINQFRNYLENMDQIIVERMEALRVERIDYEADQNVKQERASQTLEECGRVITQHITDVVSSYQRTEEQISGHANAYITPFTLKMSTLKEPETERASFKGPELVINTTSVSPP